MQVPILSGIYADGGPDIRTNYPVNLTPVIQQSGISSGYLRPADGITQDGTGPDVDRGAINWNGVCFRVMGSKLVSVDRSGAVTTHGDVGNDGKLVTMDYSFDRLAIASNGNLFYWDNTTLTQVTDPDLGVVVDVKWVDGYFMTTDGESLIVTELADPTSVNPLKFGSSEIDPDPVEALLKLRNEIYALNRYTIEVFTNIGGSLFPFQRIEGAQIQKGSIGTHSCCVYLESIAFLGSTRNEQPAIYLGVNGATTQISTREIDYVLQDYTEAQLETVKLETRNDKNSDLLYVHLPDKTLVYDNSSSQAAGQPVWSILVTSTNGPAQFRARNMVYCYEQWIVGDPQSGMVGHFNDKDGQHWGETVRWEFGTMMVYNGSFGAIFHELELVGLTGRVEFGEESSISTSYSLDGQTFSQRRFITAGESGNKTKRLVWRRQGKMRNYRIQRFQGDSSARSSFARLEADIEQLGR